MLNAELNLLVDIKQIQCILRLMYASLKKS